MNKFLKIELDIEKATDYAVESLKDTNILSKTILESINFREGHFFTYLPLGTSSEQYYKFKTGWIATKAVSFTNPFIFKKFKQNKDLMCVFDDFNSTFKPGYDCPLFLKCGRYFQKEIYYLLFPEDTDFKLFETCYHCSDNIWHSLCILTECKIAKLPSTKLSIQEIKTICLETRLIILTAYDGEGCIIWEKL